MLYRHCVPGLNSSGKIAEARDHFVHRHGLGHELGVIRRTGVRRNAGRVIEQVFDHHTLGQLRVILEVLGDRIIGLIWPRSTSIGVAAVNCLVSEPMRSTSSN